MLTQHSADGDAPRISVSAWLDVVRREYLDSFIRAGGASVKVAVSGADGIQEAVWARLRDAARDAGYLVAEVRSEDTKVHLAQEVFFRIAEQLPWEGLATSVAADVIEQETGYRAAGEPGSLYDSLRQRYALERDMVRQSVYKGLTESVFKDAGMARDFRLAMLPLCRDASGAFGNGAADSEAIIAWLTGRPMKVTSVKAYQIFSRITRANATFMFDSLLHWIRKAGRSGLVLLIDLRRLVEVPPRPKGDEIYYTRADLLDAYEVLRQLIDRTDRMEGCLVVGFTNSDFLSLESLGRGMMAYQALFYRLSDEVRGKSYANPLASLVRLAP